MSEIKFLKEYFSNLKSLLDNDDEDNEMFYN